MINIEQDTGLYPPIQPYTTGFLKVSNLHTLYYEESGNPQGIPIVHLHGGPGSASKPKHRQIFNPEKYRIILFDQRGCGQSTPKGELQDNTTQHLLEDIETLRNHLNINQWHVFGGSWGSTLALTYAETYPTSVSALIVYAVFLAEQWGFDWFGKNGLALMFPDAYEKLQQALPATSDEERLNLCLKLIQSPSRADNIQASAFAEWEGVGMTFFPTEEEEELLPDEEIVDDNISYMRTFMHYESNHCFLPEGFIIQNADKLKNIPGAIIHGRYDLCCPVKHAWQLHKAWPTAKLNIVHQAAHRMELPLNAALTQATDEMAKIQPIQQCA
ncbi:MAG: prolyl aminopeptidase [Alphaproteobacteria bacterium]|nr:prolyl aminopeptidase [Alphaproteobacteria bacterium]MDD9920354.1 prolyl aminopeptidase [Alphaproteobacteria bacterium]